MKARQLTTYQLRELDDHFRVRIPDTSQRLEALRRIDFTYQWVSLEVQRGKSWIEECRKERERLKKHLSRVKEQAKTLRALLEEDEPQPWKVSWGGLKDALHLLEASAAEEVEELEPKGPGAPTVTGWRDSLIIVVHTSHPGARLVLDTGAAVSLLLGYLVDARLLPDGADVIGDRKRTVQHALKCELNPSLRHFLEAKNKQGVKEIRPELAALLRQS